MIGTPICCYIIELKSKQQFRDRNKIKNLLLEQKMLLNNIPDGTIIYTKEKDVDL